MMKRVMPDDRGAVPGTYTNPVYDGYHADPFVWFHKGTYYSIGTGAPEAYDAAKAERVLPVLRSKDLVQWEFVDLALKHPDRSFGDAFWAPEVAYHDGMFYLYYSVGHGDKNHQMRVAVSPKPEGPYEDVGKQLIPLEKCAFAIDAHPFRDDDGQWYLFYARDFLDTNDGNGAGTALVVDRLVNMTTLAGEEKVVMRARYDWQIYQRDREMYGRRWDWHTMEGPFVLEHGGKYYCLYSGGCWDSDRYGVDYGVAGHPTGPYDSSGGKDGPRILRTIPNKVYGPGHCSVVKHDLTGRQYVVYHAWDAAKTARRMCIDPLVWTPDGPTCLGPTTDEQVMR
jgi:beta-xylosidase